MSNKQTIVDFGCKAGGTTKGLQQAGFYAIGVDKDPQPHYCGDEFVQADYTEMDIPAFVKRVGAVAVVGGPPCQFGSVLTPTHTRHLHPNLIPYVRKEFIKTGLPYVIENVAGSRAHLVNPLMLCGSMFNLEVWRHRYFENNFGLLMSPASCNHGYAPVLVSGSPRRKINGVVDRTEPTTQARRDAMGIDWMNRLELDEAIPPAYTRYIGLQLMNYLEKAA
jgi:DNA (cytosine-5)-methyltransferase 1